MSEEQNANLDAALKLMAPIISHEIRNPLAVIGNSSYFIKAKLGAKDLDPKVLKHLGIIETEIKHANDVLGEILAYARMREPSLKETALNPLVEDALGALPAQKNVKVEKSIHRGELTVRADAELLSMAIRHLVRNAFEAVCLLPDGGSVRVQTTRDGSRAVLEVSDSGPGIKPEVRAKLFSPFNTDRPRGIGLGLAYTAKVLSLHKGSLELLDAKTGARFRLALPAA
ncbi:MAG: HAMP domain-containing sensor histidine kinase [Elusimicrobiota bacterium]